MLKEIEIPEYRRYRSKSDYEPIGFFSDCLCNAVKFDLMLGFFSSSAINVLCDGFATFLYNGGRMRLVINDILTEQDRNAIALGTSSEEIPYFDIADLEGLKDILSERDRHFFECLAWLVRNNRLELRIIAPKEGIGIAHTKAGVFSDKSNKICFDGSCNFSKTALIDNIESLSVSCDWDGKIETERIKHLESDFENIFFGKDDSVLYVPVEKIKDGISKCFKDKEIHSLLEDEYRLLAGKSSNPLSKSVQKVLERAKSHIVASIERIRQKEAMSLDNNEPHFPYPSGPRDYQVKAFENWKANKQQGLFAMATGTGKTITSLNCLLEIYKRFGFYKAIILVPTITLVEQWEKECRKFGFENIIKASSKNTGWKEEVSNVSFSEKYQGKDNTLSYIIISTYASFCKQADAFFGFQKNRLLLIADEAHNLGTKKLIEIMENIPYSRRIGLSATPDRQYDEEGTTKIKSFFGVKDARNYTFEYSMKEAIENGALCRYYYYPHIVALSEEEMKEYAEKSVKIGKYFSVSKDRFVNKDKCLTALLLQRKRIIHKAEGKLSVFKSILEERIKERGSLKYTLVYVPEGNRPDEAADIYVEQESYKEDDYSDKLIDQYSSVICDIDSHTTVRKFTAETIDRDILLSDFAEGRLDVLTSMKCLDEGVDVPRSELAIFCASTGNPRQFIQRRGRILRTHPDKKYAVIHDLVVVPNITREMEHYEMERSLLKTEMKRVKDFSLLSENPTETIMRLKDVLDHYGISIYDL